MLGMGVAHGVFDEEFDFRVLFRNLGDKDRYGCDVARVEDIASCGIDLGCG
jgi:hypothetical protein